MRTLENFLCDCTPADKWSLLFDPKLRLWETSNQQQQQQLLPAGVAFDAIVLCGSAAVDTIFAASNLWHLLVRQQKQQSAAAAASSSSRPPPPPPIIISGGVGHSTSILHDVIRRACQDAAVESADSSSSSIAAVPLKNTLHVFREATALDGQPEAAVFGSIMRHEAGVPGQFILPELDSKNCGENAQLAVPLLLRALSPLMKHRMMMLAAAQQQAGQQPPQQQPPQRVRVALFQDPTMQRRSRMSFEKHSPSILSASGGETVPLLDIESICCPFGVGARPRLPAYHFVAGRYKSLLLGEIPRLRNDSNGYGPAGKGFIGVCDIPEEVEKAYEEMVAEAAVGEAARELVKK